MSEVKTDRRILRTRHSLRDALLHLLDEKDYSSITVEDITERANLGRTTFYLHYRDKEDLLLEEVIELIQDLTHQIAGVSIAEWLQPGKPQASLVLLFQHIKTNARIYRLLLNGEGSLQSMERLGNIFINAIYELSELKGEVQTLLENSRVPLSFLGYYFSGALFATVIWWLDEGLASPVEQIAGLFQEIVLPGMGKIMG